MKYVVLLLTCCLSLTGLGQNDAIFERANALYNDGKYAEAIDLYQSILESETHSSELYFNLGNANYKLNNIAPSIYYYEKALQLSPNDNEIKNNLNFAKNMTIDAIDKVPKVGFSRIINNIVNTFSADIWAKITVAGVILFVVLFLLFHFSLVSNRKRVAFVVSLICLVLACFALIMAFQKESLVKKNNPAIVFAQESRVKSEANKTSEELFRLHEGTKVQVLEAYENWNKIQLSDNSTGWIRSEDIRLLK